MDPYIVTEQVINIIIEQLGLTDDEIEDIRLDTCLIGDLGADSLDIVELTGAFMETFDIFISDEEVQSLVHKDFIGSDIEIQNFLGLIMYKIEERERLEKEEK
ncbi:phosphopantetheine-binding protein [Megasphaera elsdenii]|uniref:phosphopantetheine-binding protein n=1 Tax=Megasphaera elsdenii TaxID=907 RepID=UPI001D0326C2|nr:phosphopantetheine-binding protein [Megasphaera elsdenii]MCB5703597.1 phosphopantetheine-binding protein [Megasphaera elsdenii]MCB5728371.1 phosphopantetheine-binding protein [Megasphaera elsdenii]MCB5772149.1 phosphopantetheine-binding protein [Megasphaera elsdenii]